jgi:NitT/TauT family transport system substrate-binding protein
MPMDRTTQPLGRLTRRRFVQAVTGVGLSVAGASLLAGCGGRSLSVAPSVGEARPETTKLRLIQYPSLCFAPQYVAADLLRDEGFTDVEYVRADTATEIYDNLSSGAVDITQALGGSFIVRVDQGNPIVLLAGGHVGCYELVGTGDIRAIRDLKGKTVAVPSTGSAPQVLLSSMLSYIGLDPRTDVNWVTHTFDEVPQLLATGQVDAFMSFPPEPQELRARQIGHVMVRTATDKPWSNYFCCMFAGNREFVRQHPVATKRALRAILKANDLCAAKPEQTAQLLVDQGHVTNYDYALQAMQEIPYSKWREYDPDDTIRFYSLLMQQVGFIKSAPQSIIDSGTDWRFLNELKHELKA